MRKCPFCVQAIPDATIICPQCGRDLAGTPKIAYLPKPPVDPHPGSIPVDPDPEISTAPIARVSVVDVNMPFASMVGFMVKWALAAIPAFFMLAVVGAVVFLVLAALAAAIK